MLPNQSPEAVQPVVLALFQLNVVEPFIATVVGDADRLTVGDGTAPTLTLTVSFAAPPGPVQVNTKLASVHREIKC